MAQQGPTGAEMALQWYARANLGTLLWRVHGQCSIDMLSQATLSDCNIIIAITCCANAAGAGTQPPLE